MRKTLLTIALLSALGALGLSGCDVKKTQEGKYQVTPPDVTVSKTQKEVTVPKVEVTPGEDKAKQKDDVATKK
jgi:hypothetical protein